MLIDSLSVSPMAPPRLASSSSSSSSSSSIVPLSQTLNQTLTLIYPHPRRLAFKSRHPPPGLSYSPPLRLSCTSAVAASASMFPSEDLVERDWSFLEPDSVGYDQEWAEKARRIIAAGQIHEGSRVLAALPTIGFAGLLADLSPCELLLATHESLFVLAMIKESHDRVRCWQGEIAAVPERFSPFDVVFACYFPGLGVSVDQLLTLLPGRCSPGARLVIGFDRGREIIEQNHRQQYPDMVTFDLPDKITLAKAATDHSFQITEFVDEPTFYLAVLRLQERGIPNQ
ncbi:uncharacterized protein LOC103712949 [Phoenix dactylifera]|uniref:Uncharacterized protein LOC103712949 n=1 Tax=Phoenix dactylifera TaxID=42345 RepID=A0A8B7CF73_PHODC|nr:uncharacterized protein LOC103712949 [Phoenix dactylifera]